MSKAAVLWRPQKSSHTPYSPTFITSQRGTVIAAFQRRPVRIILHSSRSGLNRDALTEYRSTANYAASGIELGWNATIGPDIISEHIPVTHWGYNARAASSSSLAVEIAQGQVHMPISDSQVNALAWWIRNRVLSVYGSWELGPTFYPTHAEVEVWGLTGQVDGKTDVFPYGDRRADELRQRLWARLSDPDW